MSPAIPPLEAIHAGFDAFNRGDYDAWITGFDEDVELLDLAETPDTGVFRGHAGRGMDRQAAGSMGEGFRFEPQSITQGDNAVVVDTRASGVGTGSGLPIEMTVYMALRFRDQRVVWTRSFTDRTEALEAAGLRE